MKKVLALIVLGLLAFCQMSHANFELGFQYYEDGEMEKAYREFMLAASYGDKDAQYNLGVMYYRGEHVEQDPVEGYAWFALALGAADNDESALHNRIFGQLDSEQQQRALSRKQALLDRYNDEVIAQNLSPVLTPSASSKKSHRPLRRKLPEFPRAQARRENQGWVDVVFTVEKNGSTRDHMAFYSSNDGFTQAALDAMRHWVYEPGLIDGEPAITTGVRNRVWFQMANREIDQRHLQRELSRMQKDAASGGAEEQFRYAYFLGSLTSQIDSDSINDNPTEWYEKSAQNGHGAAAYFLGLNILTGTMCEADSYKSTGWLLKAAAQNITDAQYTLAIEYLTGANFERDETKALYWMARASSQHIPAKLRYTWVLATHPDDSIRNGQLAEELAASVDQNYHDKQSLYEALAAAAAESGKLDTAIKWQTRALEDAKSLEIPTERSEAILASYQEGQPWRERL